MTRHTQYLAHASILAALYAVLTYLQNLLLPGSATWAIQLRLSEALCALSFFTPAAAPGLAIGCMIFNLCYSAALPLDFLVGPLATYLACRGMWLTGKLTVRGIPLPGLLLPALTNGVLVGWELSVYIGGMFWLNAVYVAIGELIVLLVFGTGLYTVMKRRHLDSRLFGE
ncbi:MAG: QueT transporter family protein [Oscillospiraceae bacterium]|nr:QueT transporter family protein [Oscillospiraceae bacterium]